MTSRASFASGRHERLICALFGLLFSAAGQAQDNWQSGAGLVWRNASADQCWRSSHWTPATAFKGCDGAIVLAAPAPVAVPAPARPVTRLLLLPDAQGKVGQIELSGAGAPVRLNRAFEQATADTGAPKIDLVSRSEFETRYGALYRALPRAAASYTLYFESGADRLTAQSQALLGEIRSRLADYQGVEVVITGHTDRQGTELANDALSLRRANAVRTILLGVGFPGERMETVGRGEREPVVPGADGVAEPRNRRVEVKLR